jgi:signal peptidase I
LSIAVAVTVIFNIMFGIAIVSGTSMEPALFEGDVIILWKLSNSYERGEIVLIKTNGREDYVKRICALPGENVAIDDESGAFLTHGKTQYEPYIYEKTYSKSEIAYPLNLSPDEYFVMGDHRSDSRDSRNYGAVRDKQIDGKVIVVIRKGF